MTFTILLIITIFFHIWDDYGRQGILANLKQKDWWKKQEGYANKYKYDYIVALIAHSFSWAGYGVREFYFSGKCDKDSIPFVYDYDDHNGLCDQYELRKLTNTTTGNIYAWTASKTKAEELANAMNHRNGEDWRNCKCNK